MGGMRAAFIKVDWKEAKFKLNTYMAKHTSPENIVQQRQE